MINERVHRWKLRATDVIYCSDDSKTWKQAYDMASGLWDRTVALCDGCIASALLEDPETLAEGVK